MSETLIPDDATTVADLHRLREKYAAEAQHILTRSDAALSDDESARVDALESTLRELDVRIEQANFERTALANFRAGAYESTDPPASPQFLRRGDPWTGGDLHRADGDDLRSRALTAMERMAGDDTLRDSAYKAVEGSDDDVARWALTASAPAYSSAFSKVLRDPIRGHLSWTAAEAGAYRDVAALEQRLGSTSNAAGGYAIPTALDPAFVIDNVGAAHPFRQIATVKKLATGNVWNGVTSAGVNVSFDTESSEVSDDSPTLGRSAIPVYRQAGFVGGSFELLDDAPNFGSEVAKLFTDSVEVSEATAFISGNGTTEPQGIVTALMAEPSRWLTHATNSAMTATDLINTQNALGPRWQARASWVGSLAYHNRVRAMGNDSYYTRTATFDQGVTSEMLGRPAYECSTMSTALSSITNVAWVYGDFSGYNIIDKVGTRLEYIPHIFGDGNRPRGVAGWYLFRRVGGELVTTTNSVLSVNPGA